MRIGFLLISLLSVSCFGQRYVKIGLNLAKTSANAPYGAVERTYPGVAIGMAFTRQWSEKIAIRPEFSFIQKGFRFTSSTEEFKVRLNYIEVPVLFVVNVKGDQEHVMFQLEFGPSIAYGIGGKYALKSSQPQGGSVKFGSPPTTPSQDLYFENPVDFGIQIGFAFAVKQRWLFELRYAFGLISVDEPPNPLPSGRQNSDYVIKNSGLQFTLGRAIGR